MNLILNSRPNTDRQTIAQVPDYPIEDAYRPKYIAKALKTELTLEQQPAEDRLEFEA